METEVAAIAAAIAFAALVVSIVVAIKQARIATEQTAIQKRLAAVEEARRAEEVEARTRARVTVTIVRVDDRPAVSVISYPSPPGWLILYNEGPVLARSVELVPEQGPGVPPIVGIEALPVDLQPGQQMTFQVPVTPETAAMLRVTVRWADGAGGHVEPFTLQIY